MMNKIDISNASRNASLNDSLRKKYLSATTPFLFCLLALLLMSNTAFAQNEGRWYNVEVLIFKRLGTEAFTQESWRNNIKLAYPNQFEYLQPDDTKNFALLPDSSHQLGGYNYTLRRNENYQILSHRAWKQQMQGEDESPAIIVSGGRTIDTHKELEGYIKIHIARYLHLTTDLWLTNAKGGLNQASDNSSDNASRDITNSLEWPAIPPRPKASSNRAGEVRSLQSLNNYRGNYPLATLRERRRMRSNELHYIDHPLMGVLVMITPIETD